MDLQFGNDELTLTRELEGLLGLKAKPRNSELPIRSHSGKSQSEPRELPPGSGELSLPSSALRSKIKAISCKNLRTGKNGQLE